ncbi:phosphopantetheine-binding protein [Parapedobacter sp. 10938]|uniref:phosphopantetheine-binding protein n=1 Tax=Parapedobacter flavus TaxID=3110225 RepID=UPI002DB9E22A|nr:phosphopantetheine-binding protein [Parapedobacter sp. 10938]MEC3879312.1 phosphopantetheine-binding protein [Parapedobacter sp. 10938]
MSREEIIDITNRFLIEEFEVESDVIRPGADLKESLDLDSLDYVDLVVLIESNFGIKLESKDFTNVNTFDNLYDLIGSKIHAIA